MRQYSSGNEIIKLCIFAGDFIILNFLLLAFMQLTPDVVPPTFFKAPQATLLVANFSMAISQYYFSSIVHLRTVTFESILQRILRLTILQVVVMFVFLKLFYKGGTYFKFMIVFAIVEFITILMAREIELFLLKKLRRMGRNTRTVLFIGNDPAIVSLYKTFIANQSTGYRIKGYYSNAPIPNQPEGLNYLGNINDLNVRMADTSSSILTEEVFCCMSHSYSEEILKIMKYCDKNVIRFYYVPRQFGNVRLNLKPEIIGDMQMFTNYVEPLTSPINKLIKRTFDIVISSVICLCMLPFIPIIALIIKYQSPGPIFFKQKRTGLNGSTFNCLKFRSMKTNGHADTVQATKDDPRKFPFGNFMRKTNIDEFPQFFNVLKGDMSIVGPRPHMLHHTEIYSKLIDQYMVRHFSKPGITGWAQVTGFRGETKELWQMEERIHRDIWYIENWTFWLDIKIMLLTAKDIIIPDKHAY